MPKRNPFLQQLVHEFNQGPSNLDKIVDIAVASKRAQRAAPAGHRIITDARSSNDTNKPAVMKRAYYEPIAPQSVSRSTVRQDPRTGRIGLSVPVDGDWSNASFSDGGDFGPRKHPVHGGYSDHTGLDFSVAGGSPIYAPKSGIIDEVNLGDSIYGNQVIMRHGPKLQSMYGHMAEAAVNPGQRVKRGDIIGYVGSTGLSTGNHLHWETWRNGNPIDPRSVWDPSAPRRMPKRQPRVTNATAPSNVEVPSISGDTLGEIVNSARRGLPVGNREANAGNPRLDAFLKAISTQESGGNYGAVGVPTRYGTAYGKYQILDANIEGPQGWDMEALGRNIDINEFLNSPELQEKIAQAKLADYFRQYGPGGAAKAWYAGPGNAYTNSNSPQYGGPSINGYANSVLAHMRDYL